MCVTDDDSTLTRGPRQRRPPRAPHGCHTDKSMLRKDDMRTGHFLNTFEIHGGTMPYFLGSNEHMSTSMGSSRWNRVSATKSRSSKYRSGLLHSVKALLPIQLRSADVNHARPCRTTNDDFKRFNSAWLLTSKLCTSTHTKPARASIHTGGPTRETEPPSDSLRSSKAGVLGSLYPRRSILSARTRMSNLPPRHNSPHDPPRGVSLCRKNTAMSTRFPWK